MGVFEKKRKGKTPLLPLSSPFTLSLLELVRE